MPDIPIPTEDVRMLETMVGIPLLPTPDEFPNPIRAQLQESRDKIPQFATVTRTIIAIVNNTYDVQLGFAAASVLVHNPTPYWWYLDDIAMFVPPAVINFSIPFPSRPQNARIRFFAPIDYAQPAVAHNSSFAVFIFGDKPIEAHPIFVAAGLTAS